MTSPIAFLILPVFAIAAIWYLIVYLRAEQPRENTLEWISMYDKPAFRLIGARCRLEWTDAVWCFVPAVMAALVRFLLCWKDAGLLDGTRVGWPIALLAAASAAVAYLGIKSVTGSLAASLLGADLLALCCFMQDGMSLPVVLTILFLWLWMTNDGYGFGCWGYLGAAVVSAISGLLFASGFMVLMLPVFGCVIFTLIYRIRRENYSILRAVLQIVFMLAVQAIAMAAVAIPYAMAIGMVFPESFWDGDFLQFLGESLRYSAEALADFRVGLTTEFLWSVTMVPTDLMLALIGLPALLAAVIRRWAPGALYLLIWNVTIDVLLVLYGGDFLMLVAALNCGWITARLLERKKPVAAYVGSGIPVLVTLAATVLIFLMVEV